MEGPLPGTLARQAPSRIRAPESKRIAHDDGIFIGRPQRRQGVSARLIGGVALAACLSGVALIAIARVEPVAMAPQRPATAVDRLAQAPEPAPVLETVKPVEPPSASRSVALAPEAPPLREAPMSRSAAPAAAPVVVAVAEPPAPSYAPVERMSEAAVQSMMERANTLLSTGDVAAARRLVERVAGQGDAKATFALAEMYDPEMLSQWKVRGALADPDKARTLYAQALRLGDIRAQDRLN
jgi:hypothetical protein